MFYRMGFGLLGSGRPAVADRMTSDERRQLVEGFKLRNLLPAALRGFVAMLALIALPQFCMASGLNDTGADQCGDVTTMSPALCPTYSSDQSAYPRQDANFGRDALAGSLGKVGQGSKGFDFTKIANNGSDLPASALQGSGATEWACTRDNVTGLVWEVKTTAGLHSQSDTFSWYQSTNGAVGTPSGGSCQNTGRCDTEKFVADVNFGAGICGQHDWRLPTAKEIEGLSDFGLPDFTIDHLYFPNTAGPDIFWTSTTDASASPAQFAWSIQLYTGGIAKVQLATAYKVRLVRGAPVSRQFVLNVDAARGNTVIDSSYNLMWKQQYEMNTPGQPAPQFSLNPDTFDWSHALMRAVADRTGGFSDWRLPNIKELRSLVDESRVNPALDPIFPALIPASVFWSSTPAQNFNYYTDLSWTVQFDSGVDVNLSGRSGKNYVRLVRDLAVAPQTIGPISFTPSTLAVGGTTTASATGGASGNTVTFSSTTPASCSVTSTGLVTGVGAGSCTVAANQPGNALYAQAPQVTQSIAVAQGSQTIGPISFSPSSLGIGGTATASATGGLSGNPVTFGSTSSTSICTVSAAGVVTGVGAGTCTVAASQSGNADYMAAPQVTANIVVKIGQTIGAISFTPSALAAGGTTTASATGGASGNPVIFSSTSLASICTVTPGGLVTGAGVGTCAVVANQAGNATYADASAQTASILVSRAPQSIGAISFSPINLTVGGSSTASATASSGLPVSFASDNPAICTVSASTITGVAAGTCNIVANQAGNANYLAATAVVRTIPFSQSQSISAISFSPNYLAVNGTTTVSATATSGLQVVFNAGPTSICTVSGSTVTGVATGTCIIAANQGGDATHLTAPQVTRNISVKMGQSIDAVSFSPASLAVSGMTAATATTTPANRAVSFSSSTPGVCDVTPDGTVTGKTIGTCTIAADQLGDTSYVPANQRTAGVTVAQGPQSIGAITLASTLTVSGTSIAQATASSLLPVSFTSATSGTCTVSGTNGSTVTGVSVGLCTLTASQAGDPNYLAAAPVSQGFTVLASQSITPISFSPTSVNVGGTSTATATTSSGLPVTLNSASPTLCAVSGNTVTGMAVGLCTITASQAGDGTTWAAAAPVVQNLTVALASQTIGTISFTPNILAVSGTTTVSVASVGGSGNAVIFSSNTPSTCTVNGSTVTGVAAGPCTIAADQAGNANYSAAPQRTQGITVSAGAAVTFTPPSLTFAAQNVGTISPAQSVVLTNSGAATLYITGIQSTVPTVFGATHNCTNSLAPGAACTLNVSFAPDATGPRVGAITASSNVPNSPLVTVSGTGIVLAPVCTLTAAPAIITKKRSSTLTPVCNPAAANYSWTGGTCAGSTAASCIVTPAVTTVYSVTGSNGSSGSSTASATVTVKPVDMTPILNLLLD